MRANLRQFGQLDWILIQSLMQRAWKVWKHARVWLGLVLRGSRQIEHCSSFITSSLLGPCHSDSVLAPGPWVRPAHGATVAAPALGRRERSWCLTRSTIFSVVNPDRLLLFWTRTSRKAMQMSGLCDEDWVWIYLLHSSSMCVIHDKQESSLWKVTLCILAILVVQSWLMMEET